MFRVRIIGLDDMVHSIVKPSAQEPGTIHEYFADNPELLIAPTPSQTPIERLRTSVEGYDYALARLRQSRNTAPVVLPGENGESCSHYERRLEQHASVVKQALTEVLSQDDYARTASIKQVGSLITNAYVIILTQNIASGTLYKGCEPSTQLGEIAMSN